MQVKIFAAFSDGTLLSKFGEILAMRMKYLNESARGSIAATAIQLLKSIRTLTKVAKPSKVKVEVKMQDDLFPSWKTQAGRKMRCLRHKGSKQEWHGSQKVRYADFNSKNQRVYSFQDLQSKDKTEYFIVASSSASAQKAAKSIAVRRAMRYSGLAKRAISTLMFKTNTKRVNDGPLNPKVEMVALENTSKRETIARGADGGGKYGLFLEDGLRYALDALKGGKAAVDVAGKKAMNRVASIINHKLEKSDFFSKKKIDIPFPEVQKKKGGGK